MDIFKQVEKQIKAKGLKIDSFDFNRPWGGFFVIDEDQAHAFANEYFDNFDVESLRVSGKLSPKILVVKPNARLSWQYHHRRAETWRVIEGPVGIVRSFDDSEGDIIHFTVGEKIVLKQGERHRLVGLNKWGVVAEFWQHTDAKNPSNEDDIVRVEDDYNRS